MATEDQTETAERITHTEAYEIAKRYNRSHWRSAGERARYSIPADPRRDDDLRLYAYIKQNKARDAELARVKARSDACDALEKALRGLVEINEIERIAGKPANREDSYLDAAREALSRLPKGTP